MKVSLSVLIPARNEIFLSRTVRDILEHAEGDTEVIVVLDGPSPHDPPPDDPRVRVVQLQESIGQRAATNLAARMSEARYLMKADAHCSFAQGFDRILLEDMQPDWVMVPVMKNLHAFDLVCSEGHRRYQGPSGPCKTCGKPTTMDIVWFAKPSPQSTAMYFDTDLKFGYWPAYKEHQVCDLAETMSLIGACWMVSRKNYWAWNICDEKHGSWGQMGSEISCKAWLSGGRLICNKRTSFGHLFRTQGSDFSFPYAISGRDVDKAREYSRWLWLGNNWEGQVRPLSWIIEHFAPIPGWHDKSGCDALARVLEAGHIFSLAHGLTDSTDSLPTANIQQSVSLLAEALPGFSISSKDVLALSNEAQVGGVAATPIPADVVNNMDASLAVRDRTNEYGVHHSMSKVTDIIDSDLPISSGVVRPEPIPATSPGVFFDLGEKMLDLQRSKGEVIVSSSHSMPPTQVLNRSEVGRGATRSTSLIIPRSATPSKSILYYSDGRLDPLIMAACQRQLLKADLPIISVTLKPMDFGQNIVLDAERSILTMYRQIFMGLEASTADIIYFAEHDVLLHVSHFNHIPSSDKLFSYDGNFYQVDARTGHALTHVWRSTSGLCAYRDLLLEHYRKRVDIVANRGYNVRIGHEPGTHSRPERIDDYGHEMWMASYPSIDIRHDKNLTPAKWHKEDFRSQRYTKGWKEANEVPGWGVTKGRFKELLTGILEKP